MRCAFRASPGDNPRAAAAFPFYSHTFGVGHGGGRTVSPLPSLLNRTMRRLNPPQSPGPYRDNSGRSDMLKPLINSEALRRIAGYGSSSY